MTARRVRAPRRVLLIAVAVGALLAGCGTAASSAGITAASTTSVAATGSVGASRSSPASPPTPQGTAVALLGGRQVQVPSSTPTVLFFFALGCVDCSAGAQATAAAARTAGHGGRR